MTARIDSRVGVVLGVAVVGVLAGLVIVDGPGASAQTVESLNGTGAAQDPYVVSSAADLQAIDQEPSAYFELGGDVDASQIDGGFQPIASEANPFTGHFDGNGHAITGLTIQATGTDGVGLFATVENGTVEHVRLEDVDVSGGNRVGALVGVNAGTVADASATGQVQGGSDVGGLVGVADGSVARSAADVSVSGTRAVGGLVGLNERGPIADSYATGPVDGDEAVGGVVGENRCCILRAFATGQVTGATDVGGAVGRHVSGSATDTYWDVDASGQDTSAVGTGLSTADLTGLNADGTLSNFDFAATWNTTDAYPELQWQADAATDTPTIQVGEYAAADLDGDGLYQDLNGNGRLDFDDLIVYFENMDSAGVTDNVAAFDYNANGRIDFDDLVVLFEEL